MLKSIKNDIYFLKYLYSYSKSYMLGEASAAVIEGLMPLLDIMIPKLMIDGLIEGDSFQTIVFYIALYVLLQFLGQSLSSFLTEKYVNLNEHLYSLHFLLMINRKKADLDLGQLDDPDIHQKAALAEDLIYKGIGIDMIDNFFTAVTGAVSIAAASAVLISAGPFLLLIIFVSACFSAASDLNMENCELAQRDENVYLTRVLNYYIRIMGDQSCAKEMRIYGFADWLMKKYRETLASLKKRLKNLYRKSLQIRLIRILSETAKSCGIYLYLAWLACLRKITVGEFSQYFNAAAQFSESLLDLGTFFMNLNVNGNYIDSFRDFMELEPMMKKDGTESVAEKDRLMLSLSHVRFHYRGSEKLILDDINYTFEQGKVYVLVGENGAGKTTLIQLLCRLYEPDEGTVCLNHVAADQFPLEEYRSMFSIVFQDFHYFAFTVGENIAFGEYEGKKETVQERIRQALKKAGLKKKVESLPKGMDTYLDKIFYEDGTVLSGGENQKLALARALFHEAKILILDEPCSALDPLAEDALFHAFQETAKDKITIYISHRLSSAVLADHVLFLKNGKIWESGSHEELLQKGGDYAEYYHAQAKYYQE